MRRLGRFCLIGLAVSTLSVLPSSPAWAVELPEFTVKTQMTGVSGVTDLVLGSFKGKCESDTSKLTFASKRSGEVVTTYRNCTLDGLKCNTLGSSAGVIIIPGEWELDILPAGRFGLATTIGVVHIEIPATGTLILLLGRQLLEVLPSHKKTKAFEDELNVKEGKQEVTEYENDSGEKVKGVIEASIDSGAYEPATESSDEKLTAEAETELT